MTAFNLKWYEIHVIAFFNSFHRLLTICQTYSFDISCISCMLYTSGRTAVSRNPDCPVGGQKYKWRYESVRVNSIKSYDMLHTSPHVCTQSESLLSTITDFSPYCVNLDACVVTIYV